MEDLKVSILVNCYNSEPYLKEALDSIYAQGYENFEIILVDNCSTDKTAEIAKSYDSRLKYYKTETNVPLYKARNFGLMFVSGDLLAFLDSDDYWLPHKLKHQVSLIERVDADFVYGNSFNKYESGEGRAVLKNFYLCLMAAMKQFKPSKVISPLKLIKNYDINLQTVLLKTSVIGKITFDDRLNLMGDLDFFFKLIWIAKAKIYFDRSFVSVSRIHARQLSRQNSFNWSQESRLVLKQLKPYLADDETKLFRKFFIRFFRTSALFESGHQKVALKMKCDYVFYGAGYALHYLKTLIQAGKSFIH